MNLVHIGVFAVAGYLAFNYVQKVKSKKQEQKYLDKINKIDAAESRVKEEESLEDGGEEQAFQNANGWQSSIISKGL